MVSETPIVLSVEDLSKAYKLGEIGTGTISHDLNRWIAKVRGKEDPFLKVDQSNAKPLETSIFYALKNVDFSVRKGEVIGIIGKNGAGKSTLLKIISQITAPTTGKVKIKGRIASLLEVGTGMHPEMTAKENVYLNGAILGMTKKEIATKFNEIIEFAGCEKFVDTPIKRFSSGMKVRLAFAVAAFLEPEILIVDEVLAVGDAEFQKKAIGKMKDVSSRGERTVLFVSHNMASIQNLCTSIVVIEMGKIVYQGDVEDGINYYLSSAKINSVKSLRERTDFHTMGKIVLQDILTSTGDVNTSEILQLGRKCILQFNFKTFYKVKVKSIKLSFLDTKGVIRFFCNSGLINVTPIEFHEKVEIKVNLIIDKLPLPQGEYLLNVKVYSDDGLEYGIENAKTLVVEGGDFYGFGKETDDKNGVCIEYDMKFNIC